MIKNIIFLRTFFLQALWNFERLQNIGMLYILYPVFKKLYADKEERKQALLRHIGFFNTNPYMANIIIAMVVNCENNIASGKEQNIKKPDMIKSVMAGPVAAIGDSFFWGTWRPFVSFVAILLIILSMNMFSINFLWVAPVIFIVLYNVVHLAFRYWSLVISFRLDDKMIKLVSKLEIKFIEDIFKIIGLIIITFALFFYFKTFGLVPIIDSELNKLVYPEVLIFGVIFLISFLLGKIRPVIMFYFALIFSFILGYLGI
ncbi:MAG: PTS system mannose/fructose/sorbose family transporter subunit IID [Elusimicrobia bacterium]|jgi:PTS system mannose-specific IID component|nr:PTS system mannose/fructose/sorbose family transporter subunit IID [Elusimicrobiota bacterium]MBR4633204.1 PTS system mannose/fructose/sorbose family transporter subunit IID [Elusimicrobiota bacterium]